MKLPNRQTIRMPGFEYLSGAFFVTIATHEREPLLGVLHEGTVRHSVAGEIVQGGWQQLPMHFKAVHLDAFVIMPDHLHGIVFILNDALEVPSPTPRTAHGVTRGSLAAVVQSFKSQTTRKIRLTLADSGLPAVAKPIWQRNYYEHIIRNQADLDRVRKYIDTNVARAWLRMTGHA